MKRSSFLKSLLGIAIAPKIAIEAHSEPAIEISKEITKSELDDISKLCSKRYVSAIEYLDQREINSNIFQKATGSSFNDIMKLIHK